MARDPDGMRTCLIICLALCVSAVSAPLPLEKIKLPPKFHVALYARVPGARQLALSPSGTLFVGTRGTGKVFAVGPGGSPVTEVASRLDQPNGVAFRDGALYVAEIPRVLRFDDIEKRLANPPKP